MGLNKQYAFEDDVLLTQGLRRCTKCRLIQSRNDFYRSKGSRYNLHTQCKTCSKETSRKAFIKRTYGLTQSQYAKLKSIQNNKCAICNSQQDSALHIDHCHKTGKVRGLLCISCNVQVGVYENYGSRISNYLRKK